MPKNRIIILLGIIIAIQPLLGFPRPWESAFQVVAGLSIVVFSVWSIIDKRLTLKAKAQKRHLHRQKEKELKAIADQAEEGSDLQGGEF